MGISFQKQEYTPFISVCQVTAGHINIKKSYF